MASSLPRNWAIVPSRSLCNVLRAADEADAAEAVAVSAQPFTGGRDDGGMVGQAEIIVGAEVDDLAAVDGDGRALR